MIKVFIFGQKAKGEDITHIKSLLYHLKLNQFEVCIYKEYLDQLPIEISKTHQHSWSTYQDIVDGKPTFVITLGGDGTILQAITFIRNSNIPILGINLGRLGFLASIDKTIIPDAVYQLVNGSYSIEERSLISLESNFSLFGEINFALNDFTILKRDNYSMITIHTYVNGDFLNSYWADGIIVSTPTGSTGYSLSCGGPIIFPDVASLVITPVAPHNLNVRPIVIPDHSILSFEVEGRTENFLCTLDSRKETISSEHQLAIKKADFKIRLAQLHPVSFLRTIHEKLNWGLDQRN